MSLKSYQFLCEHCGYKRFSDGTDIKDLVEIPTSPIPRGSPQLNAQAKKSTTVGGLHQPAVITTGISVPPSIKQDKKFKCPKCGFVIKAKKIKFLEQETDEVNRADGRETSTEGQSLPGELA
jgi:predicted RNA-binding Zn-ribbon protein involved in translation (DUF1610 family)